LNNPPQQKSIAIQPFQSGQIWQMESSHVHIGQVGKTLVEYKLTKTRLNRGPNHLTGKIALQKLLTTRNAILLK